MGLEEYKRKRKFDKTPEPAGTIKKQEGNSFVIQKHHATRLHYDFRLEMEGVLRSWAIPKGPSFNPADKRLAMETEDHPIDYGDFEGIIPAGNYGAGKVIIWDNGTYEMVDPRTPEEGWKKGKLHFVLNGKKLKGEWVLVRGSREPRQWIFFKVRDQYASSTIDITEQRPESVVSGKLVDQIGEDSPSKQWVTRIERELEKYGMNQPRRTPIPNNHQPMLATLAEKPFRNDDWLFSKGREHRLKVFRNRRPAGLLHAEFFQFAFDSRHPLFAGRVLADLVDELSGNYGLWALLGNIDCGGCILITDLEKDPLSRFPAASDQNPLAFEFFPVENEMQLSFFPALLRRSRIDHFVGAVVPDDDFSRTVVARRNNAFEISIIDRMVLG